MINTIEWEKFLKNINKKAILNSKEYKGLKYPYKPALLLSIIDSVESGKLFNQDIDLNNLNIIKKYYEYITYNYEFWSYITKNEKSKKVWDTGIKNITVQKQVLRNICEMPASKLMTNNSIFQFDNESKKIRINLSINSDEIEKYRKELINVCIYSLRDSNKNAYEWLEENNYSQFKEYVYEKIYRETLTFSKSRGYLQHVFATSVKDRDGKCIVCCINRPELLQACHIKPFSQCSNQIEQTDANNGITLCANHHKLFDVGLFTFDEKWNIKTNNKKLLDNDIDLFFKQYEFCYSNIKKEFGFLNTYLKFHNEKIYKNLVN